MVRYKSDPPTLEQFSAYQAAWGYFNEHLFGGTLRPCLLNFSRRAKALGFFVPDKWQREDGERVHEISLNPDVLLRPVIDTMSTLVHEMAHQWQQDHGRPPRRCYHDTEWADKMEEIGLMPSSTGEPGGKRTGQRCSHYILPDGRFHKVFQAMPEEYLIPWRSGSVPDQVGGKSKAKSKVKYQCPRCPAAVWGKPALNIVCGDCQVQLGAVSESGTQAGELAPVA